MNLLYPINTTMTPPTFEKAHELETTLNESNLPLSSSQSQFVKRGFDILFSVGVLVFVLSWMIPIVAILIKVTSRGPIFFRQKRHGLNNRLFDCLKFRTMVVNNVEGKQATKNDPRVTKVGKFLRKTSLDEFPQFLNVLMGDMSIVGPRPHFYKHNEAFAQHIDGFMTRHLVKPGITGLAQVRGFRGETNTLYDIMGRYKLDKFYMNNWSLWLDIKIVVQTFLGVLGKDKQAY